MKPLNVMLLAAGIGQRLQPYTLTTPKPAIPLMGVPLLAYSLGLLDSLKVDHLTINVHHLADQIENLIFELNPWAEEIHISDERMQLLDSGGGILKAQNFLQGHGHFLTLNADVVILPDSDHMMHDFLEQHQKSNAIATLMVIEHPKVGQQFGGVWTNSDHQVVQFAKKNPGLGLQGYHFIGPMLFADRVFSYFKSFDESGNIQPENILYETLSSAIKCGELVEVFPVKAQWFETGNPTDFKKTSQSLKQILREEQAVDQSQSSQKRFLTQLLTRYGGKKSVGLEE